MELSLSARNLHQINSQILQADTSASTNLLSGRYALSTLEAKGEHAWVTSRGRTRYGWIMQGNEFVTYTGSSEGARQTIMRIFSADIVDYIDRDSGPLQSLLTLYGVLRFKRDIAFPRFVMQENERWTLPIPQDTETFLAIENGDSFRFAGGECRAEDIEVIYIGQPDSYYRRVMGYPGAAV